MTATKATAAGNPRGGRNGFEVADPRSEGVDPVVLTQYEDAMRRYVKDGHIPGFASVVLRRGQVVHSMAHGLADVEAGTPYTMDTLCRLICMTKSYVATALMTLVDDGKVSLEDRLDKWLPSFADPQVQKRGKGKLVPARQPILLRHVLCHTSGLGYPPDEEVTEGVWGSYKRLERGAQGGKIRSLRKFVEELSKVPLLHHPGTMYEYGYSMDVVARVIEVIMGRDIEECLLQRVFRPLRMAETLWAVPDRLLPRLAACYAGPATWKNLYGNVKGKKPITPKKGLWRVDGDRAKDSNWRRGRHCRVKSGGGFFGYLHGGLVSSVADTVRFVKMLMNGGVGPDGKRLLTPDSLQVMERNRLKAAWKQGSGCYMGNIGVFRDGGKEFGMGGAACTYWSVDRADDLAAVMFTQHYDMPEFDSVKGVNPKRADLWRAMHDAVRTKAARGYQKAVASPAAKAGGQSALAAGKRKVPAQGARPAKRRRAGA